MNKYICPKCGKHFYSAASLDNMTNNKCDCGITLIDGRDAKYIIIHTREGYGVCEFGFLSFTKHIADATTFTNYNTVKTLCDTYMASAWVGIDGIMKYHQCYKPSNKINYDTIEMIRRNMYEENK